MDVKDMFLVRHERLHARVERLADGLTEEQVRRSVHPAVNPLAWLLWHIARGEDGAVSLLVCDVPQVLDDEWMGRLAARRCDVGTGMTREEAADLSAAVNLPALIAYSRAVGERTRQLVGVLSPSDLDEVVAPARVRGVVEALVTGPATTELPQHWQGITTGHFLVWLGLTHNYEHLGQADFVRGMLGHTGRI